MFFFWETKWFSQIITDPQNVFKFSYHRAALAYFCQPTSTNCFPARVVSINKRHLNFLMNVGVGRCGRVKTLSLVTPPVYLNRNWTCSWERQWCENLFESIPRIGGVCNNKIWVLRHKLSRVVNWVCLLSTVVRAYLVRKRYLRLCRLRNKCASTIQAGEWLLWFT